MSRIAAPSTCSPFGTCFRLLLCSGVCLIGMAAHTSRGQDEPLPTTAAKADEKNKPKLMETVLLETKDGLQMEADYYPSKLGKEAVPIIMLHGWKGSRADFAPLAYLMQLRGHAVIVPDLRGHGKSTQIKVGADVRSIDQGLMKQSDFEAMVTQDVEAVKRFLLEKNNLPEPELNIEKLCVIGADMGAVVGMDWAVTDWAAPKLLTIKQGQDVKALVLISPPMNFRGISVAGALSSPWLLSDSNGAGGGISVLVMVGGDKGGKTVEDAKRIHKLLGAKRPKPPTDVEEIRKYQDLWFDNLKTSLQGTKILEDRKLLAQASTDIGAFIDVRLVAKKYPWTMRKSVGD